MKKKEYKIKVENGEIKFLDAVDLNNVREGIVIFFEEGSEEEVNSLSPDPNSLLKMAGTISVVPDYKKLTPELIDSILYDEP